MVDAMLRNNSSNLEVLLKQACMVANADGLSTLVILEMMMAVLATFLNSILLYVFVRVTVFSMNLRLLLGHLSLNLIWYAAALCVKVAPMITALSSDSGYEQLITNAFACKSSELFNTIPLQNIVYTSLALCVERWWSTAFYRSYEKQHSKPYLAIVLIGIVWTISLANQLNALFSIDQQNDMPICESLLSMQASSALSVMALNLTSESLCVILSITVFIWNKYKLREALLNRAQLTLSARFLISQNSEINAIMMPSMCLQSLCYIPNYVFLLLIIFGFNMSLPTRVQLIHVNYFWKLFYGLLHPVLAFNRKARLMHHLRRRSPNVLLRVINKAVGKVQPDLKTPIEAAQDTTNAHFEVLQKIWSTNYRRHNKYNERCQSTSR